ncbi:hypothetical protein PCANC_06139 [Puccinia coronata f. sp. avenae]|uniref:Uncharacterized protein n=1 Tax=Puccinia coronata f. sp. avenae TaxID=200324 RepID=A0A2N5VTS5_9BASI|nr:hypothetical protein PCANC_06139 [Puccinia coronata f. sp. avenae]
MSDHLNATGLTAEESRKLTPVQSLYSCKPSEQSYEMYAENATFHDPLQFHHRQVSSPSEPTHLATPPGPDQFTVINQDVTYYRDGSKLKTLNSLITLERDAKGKVIRHTEEWSHDKVTDKSDGFIGQLNEWRKKLAAEVIAKLVPEEPPKGKEK